MGKDTAIGWTHRPRPDGSLMPGYTFNGWWGCEKVSRACHHCYAEAFSKRVGLKIWGQDAPRRFFGDKHWNEPIAWNRAAAAAGERHLVFTNSMADVLEDREDLVEPRARLCRLIDATRNLIWLLLTKRPENQHLLPASWQDGSAPPKNVWFGTTAENQEWFDKRIVHLGAARWAAARFVSVEPMVGKIRADRALMVCLHCKNVDARPGPDWVPTDPRKYWWERQSLVSAHYRRPFDWIIIGGESGSPRAELDLDAAWDLSRQARAAGVAIYVKQDSGPKPGKRGRLDDEMWGLKQFPEVAA